MANFNLSRTRDIINISLFGPLLIYSLTDKKPPKLLRHAGVSIAVAGIIYSAYRLRYGENNQERI